MWRYENGVLCKALWRQRFNPFVRNDESCPIQEKKWNKNPSATSGSYHFTDHDRTRKMASQKQAVWTPKCNALPSCRPDFSLDMAGSCDSNSEIRRETAPMAQAPLEKNQLKLEDRREMVPMIQAPVQEGSRKRALLEQRIIAPSKSPRVTQSAPEDLAFSARFKLISTRHVVVENFQNVLYVKIRDYFQVKKEGFPLAPGRGINLTVSEWECLKALVPKID